MNDLVFLHADFDIRKPVTLLNCGFFNNPRMNLRKSTAIVHRDGDLRVAFSDFRGAAGCEKLYEGDGKNVEWINCRASGGAGMAESLRAEMQRGK